MSAPSEQKPIIAVVGATGAQGGSVVRYLLTDPDKAFRVRALTRNLDSPKAQALVAQGIEVVRADLNDSDSMKRAFEGAYGVFGITNFWETGSGETEVRQGKTLVNAAHESRVKHFVWSTLEHTTNPVVGHANSKADVDDYLRASGVPRTSLYTVAYFENFQTLPPFSLTKTVDGKVLADWPLLLTDGPIGGYSVAETGAYALEAFKKPGEWIGKDMRIISEIFTPRQLVQAVHEVTGLKIDLRETDRKRFNAAKSISEELWNNNEWFYVHNGNPGRDAELTLHINPQRKSMRAWVEENKDRFLSWLNV